MRRLISERSQMALFFVWERKSEAFDGRYPMGQVP